MRQALEQLREKWRKLANTHEARKNEAFEANFMPGQDINRAKMLTFRDCADELDALLSAETPQAWHCLGCDVMNAADICGCGDHRPVRFALAESEEPEMLRRKRTAVYLAYVDDSGSDKKSQIVVVGAAVVSDRAFWRFDTRVGAIVDALIPPDKIDDFEEFHAAELFGGYGFFNEIPQEDRYQVIRAVLSSLPKYHIPFIYAAVDKDALEDSAFASSSPMDVAFRLCACGVADWVANQASREFRELFREPEPDSDGGFGETMYVAENPCMLIADDTDDKQLKQTLRRSYRALRPKAHAKNIDKSRLWMGHDDMYFGDSKSSIGIQLADICAHTVLRRLRDGVQDEFFDLLAPHAHSAQPEPFWPQCRHVMRWHEQPTLALQRPASPDAA